jgi:hypothetical protein
MQYDRNKGYSILSSETFKKLTDEDVMDGDVLNSKHLNSLRGVSADDNAVIIIDDTVPFGCYYYADENGTSDLLKLLNE